MAVGLPRSPEVDRSLRQQVGLSLAQAQKRLAGCRRSYAASHRTAVPLRRGDGGDARGFRR